MSIRVHSWFSTEWLRRAPTRPQRLSGSRRRSRPRRDRTPSVGVDRVGGIPRRSTDRAAPDALPVATPAGLRRRVPCRALCCLEERTEVGSSFCRQLRRVPGNGSFWGLELRLQAVIRPRKRGTPNKMTHYRVPAVGARLQMNASAFSRTVIHNPSWLETPSVRPCFRSPILALKSSTGTLRKPRHGNGKTEDSGRTRSPGPLPGGRPWVNAAYLIHRQ